MVPRGVRALGVLVFALAAILLASAAAAPPAPAIPAYVHSSAATCESCHHKDSFQPCSICHQDAQVPNQACVNCHAGKSTAGQTCWACHVPGAQQPAYADTNCTLSNCHGQQPHLGAMPDCTRCHPAGPPTPHHNGQAYEAPTCTTCHPSVQRHDKQVCTVCHSPAVHPDIPQVPAVCNRCHSADVFNGAGNCLDCHSGALPFGGKKQDDIHNENIPDAPISASSCRSCHAEAQKHAGAVACLTCHSQANAFHHGTSDTPGFPECKSCHQNMKQHGSGLSCQSCHLGAQHQTSPPTPSETTCNKCHAASRFGSGGCYRCHALPIYHVTPRVGPCSSCHGSGRQSHAGKVACLGCHTNVDSGHHVGHVIIPACTQTGCHNLQYHVGEVACAGCHGSNASHDASPLNLPNDTWSVCGKCHSFVTPAVVTAVGPCTQCHDQTQHSAGYRVPECVTCHTDKMQHAGVVACATCHTNVPAGHHKAGTVGAKDCSACHVGIEVHASATSGGSTFTCATCHQGSVHGFFDAPSRELCLSCHLGAERHASDLNCIECHWPATHAATPDANEEGGFEEPPVVLPTDPTTTTTTVGADDTPTRPDLGYTGIALRALVSLGLVLLGVGVAMRLRDRGRFET